MNAFFLEVVGRESGAVLPSVNSEEPHKGHRDFLPETSSFCENKLKKYCLGFVSFDKYQPHLWNCVSLIVNSFH